MTQKRPEIVSEEKLLEAIKVPPEVKEAGVKEQPAEPKITGDQVSPARLKEEVKEIAKPKPAEKVRAPAPLKFGRLNVQAVPWGYVYAGTSGRRYETPVTGLKLPAGRQRVQVVYPPTGDRLQRRVDIRPGKSVTCIARFGANKGLSCR